MRKPKATAIMMPKAEAEHEHEHEGPDPHIWMDPDKRQGDRRSDCRRTLTKEDPQNAATYAANVKAFDDAMDALSKDIETEIAPVKDKRYIVFHDAYQYFENRFGLSRRRQHHAQSGSDAGRQAIGRNPSAHRGYG